MSLDLSRRSAESEQMEHPGVAAEDLRRALHELAAINRLLNGYGPSLRGIGALLPSGRPEFSLLDMGCGSGDTLRAISRWAGKRGIRAFLTGIDLSETTAAVAREESRRFPNIAVRVQDLFDVEGDAQFDIVHSALVMHHITRDDRVAAALRKMMGLARLGIVVNDVDRHGFAYHAIRMLTRAFSKSGIVRSDAPLSVARGFTRLELGRLAAEAGLPDANITWHWGFRWLLIARK